MCLSAHIPAAVDIAIDPAAAIVPTSRPMRLARSERDKEEGESPILIVDTFGCCRLSDRSGKRDERELRSSMHEFVGAAFGCIKDTCINAPTTEAAPEAFRTTAPTR